MVGRNDPSTRVTLLERLRHDPANQAAWNEFVGQYGPTLYRWCRGLGLQEADAEDVTQMVLLRLVAKLRTFAYDPSLSFRAWLRTVTRHAWSDFVASRQRPGAGRGGSDVYQRLESLAARDDLVRQLEEQFDLELLQEATRRVRPRVDDRTWQAFQLLAFGGLSGAAAASRLDMKVATVFVNKSNVQKMLREEIRRLGEAPAAAATSPG